MFWSTSLFKISDDHSLGLNKIDVYSLTIRGPEVQNEWESGARKDTGKERWELHCVGEAVSNVPAPPHP